MKQGKTLYYTLIVLFLLCSQNSYSCGLSTIISVSFKKQNPSDTGLTSILSYKPESKIKEIYDRTGFLPLYLSLVNLANEIYLDKSKGQSTNGTNGTNDANSDKDLVGLAPYQDRIDIVNRRIKYIEDKLKKNSKSKGSNENQLPEELTKHLVYFKSELGKGNINIGNFTENIYSMSDKMGELLKFDFTLIDSQNSSSKTQDASLDVLELPKISKRKIKTRGLGCSESIIINEEMMGSESIKHSSHEKRTT